MEGQSGGRDSEPNEGSRARRDRRAETSADNPVARNPNRPNKPGHTPGESQSVARHNQPDERWRPRRDQGAETSADNRENRLTNPGNTPRGKSVSRSIRAAGRRGNNRGATGGHKPPRTAPRPGTQTGRTIRGTAPQRISQSPATASRTKGSELGGTDAQKPRQTTPRPGTQAGRTIRGTPPAKSQSVRRSRQPAEGVATGRSARRNLGRQPRGPELKPAEQSGEHPPRKVSQSVDPDSRPKG